MEIILSFIILMLPYTQARISVMYAHEKMSDIVAEQCLNEMYPRGKRIQFQESDEPCIIYCVLKKLGIMNSSGQINVDMYRKRVQQAHQLDSNSVTNDNGSACIESAEATQHKQDVCKKAKVFNDSELPSEPYIVERHGKTLLPQYLGMYRLTVDGIEHYLVATRNVFSNHLNIHKKYDLKGSTVDREASEKELEKELPTLKDNDFIKQGVRIDIGDAAKDKLLETLTADVDFLTKLHLMDYSLLLGVHECGRGEAEAEAARARERERDPDSDDSDSDSDTDRHGERWGYNTPPDSPRGALGRQASLRYEGIIPELDIYAIPSHDGAPKKEIYFVALIDVLTHYGVKKQAAKAAKTVKYGSNVDGISTCDPEQYGKRFIEFVAKAIEGN